MAGTRGPSTYRTRDLTQAILGAARAGYLVRQIEIQTNGTIKIHTTDGTIATSNTPSVTKGLTFTMKQRKKIPTKKGTRK